MIERKQAEILAPVGGAQQLLAAVRCGADAVYLGAQGFNARRNAENFETTDLKAAVGYCHARGVRVHVTVNTLVMDKEKAALEATAQEIAQSGADAVIIQDMAVLKLFRDRCPGISLHASTQTVVHNSDGAKFLQDIGFDRFVLARELSLKEIEKITSSVDIEAESFVHGALCMCVSGGCYLSSVIGARSGNRGLCAQPCRLDFRCNGCDHALSLKDMSYIGHIRELIDAGVSSFKIEGRMKRPEYVAAAVTACRHAMAGEPYDEEGLRAVFSRSGFTDGYLTARRDRTMFGTRTKEDVNAAQDALGRYAALYRKETPRTALKALFSMDAAGSSLTFRANGVEATAVGDVPQTAKHRPSDEASIRKNVEKLGDTPFYLKAFLAKIAPGLMLPASTVNAMRRAAAGELLSKLEAPMPHELLENTAAPLPAHHPKLREIWARFETAEQIVADAAIQKAIVPLRVLEKEPKWIDQLGARLIVELPSLCFPSDEDALEKRVAALLARGVRAVMANNIYAIELGRRLGFDVYGGWGLNIANSDALAFYEEAGLQSAVVSFELPMKAVEQLRGTMPRGLLAYGRLPLMRMRNCPARGGKGCDGCDGHNVMTDRTGRTFPLLCREKRYTALLNDVPLYTADKFRAAVDFEVLYFTTEPRDEVRHVIDAHLACAPAPMPRTGGLYYRALK